MRAIGSLFLLLSLTTITSAAMPTVGAADHLTDGEITLIYEPWNGQMQIETNQQLITTFELKSEAGYLTGATPDLVLPPFDIHTPNKFFILKTDGIGDTDLGLLGGRGISRDALAADLTLTGSVLPNGGLGNPNLCFCLPEPASMSMALIGLLGCSVSRRRSGCGR